MTEEVNILNHQEKVLIYLALNGQQQKGLSAATTLY
jgi:hypothetical protein